MDFTKPIDVTDVNNTRVEYGDMLKPLNMLGVNEILVDCWPELGVQSSRMLGKAPHNSISKKYNGVFEGDKQIGSIVPRELKVYPVVAEMADEPERYRRTFVANVAGGLNPNRHPFELWLLQYGINIASEDLFYGIMTAEYKADTTKKALIDSFDGWLTIVRKAVTSGDVSEANKNLYVDQDDEAITRQNAGDYLLNFWRSRHKTLRNQKTTLWLPYAVGDLYDDWYRDEHDQPPFVDQAGQILLEGTNGQVRLKRTAALPENSQRVWLTTRENMRYGTDDLADMKKMVAFPSGNPYLFTAAMKYVFGTQFESLHERDFACNNLDVATGSGSASA